jgi:hypothetical protein
MAHFAEIENGLVKRVIVINNEVLLDENGIEQELLGSTFCKETFGGEWKQTSYNANFRKYFAGVGYSYDKKKDEFIPPPSNLPDPEHYLSPEEIQAL